MDSYDQQLAAEGVELKRSSNRMTASGAHGGGGSSRRVMRYWLKSAKITICIREPLRD
jgi:hypothetical protein